jgi:HD-GYP domain-containing protein (c-di-GMP phosphodiesterase class II)
VKTALEKEDADFRPINTKFLQCELQESFDIFYKTEAFGTTQFVKFASATPEHQDKVRKLIEEKEGTEDFFIQADDMMKYYSQATAHLREMIDDPNLSLKDKTLKIYDVSKDIMKDFFEFNASPKILKSSEEVVELMDECLSSADADFHALFTITTKDYYTYTHSVNVGLYCLGYGVKTKMGSNDIRDLGLGGMLHDVGKTQVDAGILNKNGKLTFEEFEAIKAHAPLGKEILEGMRCHGANVIDMAGQHHEQYNGNGYPKGLAGDEISHFARICKVTDVYDALTTRRSYKKALAPFEALTVMGKEMKDEFDLEVLGKFIKFMGPDL